MADLIDRQALMRNFCGYDLTECVKYGNKTAEQQNNSYSTMMMYEIADEIEDAPAVDAVEVVRCKGCKRYVIDCECGNYCSYHTFNAECCDGVCNVTDNDFCSYGETREDDG